MSCCFEGLFKCLGGEGGPKPSFLYFVDMLQLKSIEYSKLLNWRSGDGGATAHFPGPGATAVLKHADVCGQLADVPSNWKDGTIWRGNDLGFIRVNPVFWPDVSGRFALGMPQDVHAWVRPILDGLLGQGGNWTAEEVASSAGQWLDERAAARTPFRVQNDVKLWVQILLHKVHLGIDLTVEEAQRFTDVQSKVLAAIVLPTWLNWIVGKALKMDKLLAVRMEFLEKYKAALGAQPEHAQRSPEDLHLLASVMLDSLMFAGGLSTASVIGCAMATVYSANSPCPGLDLKSDMVAPLVWETIRYYPPVVGFPWYNGPEQQHRTIASLASAQRDPDVWGDTANNFVLRDLASYHRLSIGWADAATDKANPAYNRVCPAKHLSLAMATGFLDEWAKRKDQWALGEGAAGKIKIAPTTPFISNFEFQPV